MTDKLNAAVTRGLRMAELARSEGGLFDVFTAVRANYLSEIANSEPHETVFREKAYHRVKALDDIVRVMTAVIDAGHGAEAQIRNLINIDERRRKAKKA
jgi:hypothetical protein